MKNKDKKSKIISENTTVVGIVVSIFMVYCSLSVPLAGYFGVGNNREFYMLRNDILAILFGSGFRKSKEFVGKGQ